MKIVQKNGFTATSVKQIILSCGKPLYPPYEPLTSYLEGSTQTYDWRHRNT